MFHRSTFLALALLMAHPVHAQLFSVQPAQEKYTPQQLRKHFENEVKAYEITLQDDSEPLELVEQPIMNWQNTERLQEQGAMYMWTKDGRPTVLMSIFTYELRGFVRCRHEQISLAQLPLRAIHKGQPVWTPRTKGLDWQDLTEVRQPGPTKPRRLTQMRGIARQYAGTVQPLQPPTTKLKLLPQPLVRYESPKQGIIDGAIFSYAVVTDPEILLVIEAVKDEQGKTDWRIAFARSHYWALEMKKGGKSVWKGPAQLSLSGTRAGQQPYSNEPYFSMTPAEQIPPAEELDE